MGISVENRKKFAMHIGMVVLFGGEFPAMSIQRQIIRVNKQKPIVYITVDNQVPQFFGDEYDFLKTTKSSTLDSKAYIEYLDAVKSEMNLGDEDEEDED